MKRVLRCFLMLVVGSVIGGVCMGIIPIMCYLVTGEWYRDALNVAYGGIVLGFGFGLIVIINEVDIVIRKLD